MIEIETSKTGLPVFKSEGKLLNSIYDPASEAQAWLAGVTARIENFNVVFLLGVGSAYHCLAVQKKYPTKKIIFIESDQELIGKTKELFPEINQVFHVAQARDLFAIEDVMNATEEIFCALRLPSTRFANKNLFDEIETLLTGRSSYEFEKFVERRPKLKNQLNVDKLANSNLISIKEIVNAYEASGEILSRERRVLYILEELFR